MLIPIKWINIFQTLLNLLHILDVQNREEASPSICLQASPTITTLAACLDSYTVPHDYYYAQTYNLAQPDDIQRKDWKSLITSLLHVNGNCSSTRVPSSLEDLYIVDPFQEFCILYETVSQSGIYRKGWGFMIVPASRSSISRNVHISAPHPAYDLGTVEQAAFVFASTGSNSLLVPGRSRTAYMNKSDCILPASPTQDYYQTDPSHNDQEPFFDASVSIHEWQYRRNGCPSSSCAFLQFHGKGALTCPSDHIFLSSGLGNSAASKRWYTDSIDRPVKRLQRNLRDSFPSWNISMPSDSNCSLTATKNIVGRYLNGAPIEEVCSRPATSKTATGEFIHIEQAAIARKAMFYDRWSAVLLESFEPVCADRMTIDPLTKLCTSTSMDRSVDKTLHIYVHGSLQYRSIVVRSQWTSVLSLTGFYILFQRPLDTIIVK